jgi:CPA2 family monovalent cation:H+ antiporter-2
VSVGQIGLKALAAAGAARLVGLGGGFALRLGANLAQGSEFGFVVLSLAAQAGVVEPRVAAIGTAGIALSMALTAATARAGDALAERVESRRARSEADSDPVVASTRHRVLLAGIGPVAQAVARALEAMDVDYLALEWDPLRLAEGRAAGFHVVYGRADDMALVEAAGASQALVLGRNRPDDVRAFVSELLSRQPGLQVLLRASSEQEASELRALGALACVCAEDPDDRTLALETLRALGIDEARIARWQNAFEPDPEWEKADKAHAFSAA